ncbi:MAG: DUF2892 domain-containing protein [Candidatus Saccharicenans sp.]|nr:DUF2892 domain-containing protein [Candidatus Saccharicenans sp.]MDI6848520.1 DUF2892 domain-containing protein [Candidatus Saccharicenans sp.]
MKKNMGAVDRTIRTILAVIMAVLVLTGAVKGTVGYILAIVAFVFLATSLFGFCPLYVPLGISTLGRKKSEQ